MPLIGINTRRAAPKHEALKLSGRELAIRACTGCGESTVVDAEALKVARGAPVSCSDCIDRELPPLPPMRPAEARAAWVEFGDGSKAAVQQMRSIRFPAPIESYAPDRLSDVDALEKVTRAGAPAEATQSLREVLAGKPPGKAMEAALNWYAGIRLKRPLLALMGPTGCGKSTASARAAMEFAAEWPWNSQAGGGSQREPLVWLNAEEVARLQAWQRDGARQYDEALHARLLVIDDVGHEDIRPAIAAMSDLLMRRIDARRATVLSTNLRGKAFTTRYGRPVTDRLKTRAVMPELEEEKSFRRARPEARDPGEEG